MGSNSGEAGSQPDERPLHQVELEHFWIDETEVRWAQYLDCVADESCAPAKVEPPLLTQRDLPVVGVSWHDAMDYCDWAGRRLPTEAEWEKAARGRDGRPYPWGWIGVPLSGHEARMNFCDLTCAYAFRTTAIDDGYEETAPVGTYFSGASPYGALDMAGNVWEWTSSWYTSEGYSQGSDASAANEFARVIRGGSWIEPAVRSWVLTSRAANRGWLPPERSRIDVGFRCVLGLESEGP
jgi:formylglycine-generating enzyme required for sulfatase activity